MMFKSLPALLAVFAAFVFAKNPNVLSPGPMTYTAGKTMEVTWAEADTGFVNIDVVHEDPSILSYPMMIATVPAQAGKYSFILPESLKSAGKYHVRVWGDHQPQAGSSAISQPFTVLNIAPQAINTFVVTSPNPSHPCVAGKVCKIAWDFPPNIMYPAMVDVALYKVGNPYPIEHIGTFDSSLKSTDWVVPKDSAIRSGDVYISVSGQGQPPLGPGQNNDMSGNSQAFVVAAPGESSSHDAQSDVNAHSKKDDMKEKEEMKKNEKKNEKKPEPPKVHEKKVAGAAAKNKNSASQVSVSAGIFVSVAAAALMSVLF